MLNGSKLDKYLQEKLGVRNRLVNLIFTLSYLQIYELIEGWPEWSKKYDSKGDNCDILPEQGNKRGNTEGDPTGTN